MIIGLKNWNNINTHYIQNNNPEEEILRKDGLRDLKNLKKIISDNVLLGKINKIITPFLESCGPTAGCSVLSAMGKNIDFKGPGEYNPKPDSVFTDFFNDPEFYKEMQSNRKEIDPSIWFGNEIPQFYPFAIKKVFGIDSDFFWSPSFGIIEKALSKNNGIMLCFRNPGHWIGVVGIDIIKRELIYNDPNVNSEWPERYIGKSGFNRRLTEKEFNENVQGFYIEIKDKI